MTLKQILLVGMALVPFVAFGQVNKNDYLRKVLHSLAQIEAASYYTFDENYAPGDTIPQSRHRFCREYNNPADTTIGASFVVLNTDTAAQLEFGYDGQVRVVVDDEMKELTIDDFTARPLPFRPLPPPFFNYTKSILRYALTTSDRIETQLEECGDAYHFRLVIDEDRPVEFFGKAYHIPSEAWDPRSIYEIWIAKEGGLPYKVRREQAHDTTVTTISNVAFEPQTSTMRLTNYYPADYTIRKYGQTNVPQPQFDLTGKRAPDWTLNDADNMAVSLGDFKSKILLINFTGIGCGACHLSIPLLNALKTHFPATDFDLVAIETWGKEGHSLRAYETHNDLNYKMLHGTSEVIRAYLPNGAVPVFILLDEHRTIRHIFKGYSKQTTNAAITQAIDELLQNN